MTLPTVSITPIEYKLIKRDYKKVRQGLLLALRAVKDVQRVAQKDFTLQNDLDKCVALLQQTIKEVKEAHNRANALSKELKEVKRIA